MTEQTWSDYGTASTIFAESQSASVTDGSNIITDALDSDGLPFMDLDLLVESGTGTRAADAHIKVYVLPAIDDTNYVGGSTSVDPMDSNEVYSVLFPTAAGVSRQAARGIVQPPNKFKILLMQELGLKYAASNGVIATRRTYNLKSS